MMAGGLDQAHQRASYQASSATENTLEFAGAIGVWLGAFVSVVNRLRRFIPGYVACNWHGEIKRCSLVRIVFRPETAAVSHYNNSADCQAHANPITLGGVKRLEHCFKLIFS